MKLSQTRTSQSYVRHFLKHTATVENVLLLFLDHATKGGEDRQIPLLKDVFGAFPNLPINIDIKIDNDDLIRKVTVYNNNNINK